jgi:RNA recognition motif-containing protein
MDRREPARRDRKENVKSIFVGNLSSNATESSIRSMFEGYGSVDYIRIVKDRTTGDPRGFAFVEMNADAEGNRAMAELNGREIDGQKVTAVQARPEILGERRPAEPREH